MSFKAALKIEGRNINLLYADFDFFQHINKDGYPGKYPQSGFITLIIESSADNFFIDWVLSATEMKSGSLFFYKRDNMSKMKELNFSDAYCVGFREKFSHTGEHPFFMEVKLSAGEMRYGESSYKNPWFVSGGRGGEEEYTESREPVVNQLPTEKPANPNSSAITIEGIQNDNAIYNSSSTKPLPPINSGIEAKGPIDDWWKDVTNDTISDPEKLKQIKGALTEQKRLLSEKRTKLERWNEADKACFTKVFGRASENDKKTILERIDLQLKEVDMFLKDDLYKEKFFESDKENVFAHVYSYDTDHEIYLDKSFWTAPETGYNSKAGTLVHEMSHFTNLGDTDDVVYGGVKTYGKERCMLLSKDPMNADLALKNADSFEYYIEEAICQ